MRFSYKYYRLLFEVFLLCYIGTLNLPAQCFRVGGSASCSNIWSVSFADSLRGFFAGTGGEISATSDGGITWKPCVIASSFSYTINEVEMVDSTTAIIVTNHPNTPIFRTTNRGSTWQAAQTPANISLFALSFATPRYGLAIGQSVILRTTDGGIHWTQIPLVSAYRFVDVCAIDSTHATILTEGSTLFHTTTGGTRWDVQEIASLTSIPCAIAFSDTLHGLIVCNWGGIYQTTNGGNSWIKGQRQDNLLFQKVRYLTPGYVIAVSSGTILISTDGGLSWSRSYINGQTRAISRLSSQKAILIDNIGTIIFLTPTACPFEPRCISPQNHALNVSLSSSPQHQSSVSLQWDCELLATDSCTRVQVASDSLFQHILSDTSFSISLSGNTFLVHAQHLRSRTRYYWRIGLRSFHEIAPRWNSGWDFTTAGGSLGGIVFNDLDKDSVRDPGEHGVGISKVILSGKSSGTFLTDSSGIYSFQGLDSGSYRLTFYPGTPWKSTKHLPQYDTMLGLNDSLMAFDFGQYYPWNSVSGYVFYDQNENGMKEENENGMASWNIRLARNGINEYTTTDGSGYYSFPTLSVLQCSVFVYTHPGWEMFYPRMTDGYDVQFYGNDRSYPNAHFSVHPIPRRIKIIMTYHDHGSTNRAELRFGCRQGATTGIWGVSPTSSRVDFSESEDELPPLLSGTFDARFIRPLRSTYAFGNGSWVDMRPFVSPAQVDTYRIYFSTGSITGGSYPVTFSWSNDSIRESYTGLVSLSIENSPVIDMKEQDSCSISDSTIESATLIARFPALPPLSIDDPEVPVPPAKYTLYQNFPNPFNPTTELSFDINRPSFASLRIYDLAGKLVEELVHRRLDPGRYRMPWDAAGYPNGIYFYQLTCTPTEGKTIILTKKLLLLK